MLNLQDQFNILWTFNKRWTSTGRFQLQFWEFKGLVVQVKNMRHIFERYFRKLNTVLVVSWWLESSDEWLEGDIWILFELSWLVNQSHENVCIDCQLLVVLVIKLYGWRMYESYNLVTMWYKSLPILCVQGGIVLHR